MYKKLICCLTLIMATCEAAAEIRKPSFDCSKASSTVEHLICSNNQLADLDVQLNQLYITKLQQSDNKTAIKQDQISWLKSVRNACEDAECIDKAYSARLDQLNDAGVKTSDVNETKTEESISTSTTEELATKVESSPASINPDSSLPIPEDKLESEPKPVSSSAPAVEVSKNVKEISAERPSDSTLSNIFKNVFAGLLILFALALIKPSLIIRWDKLASRKTVIGYFAVAFFICIALIDATKNDETKAFELAEQKKDDAKHNAREIDKQKQEDFRKAISSLERDAIDLMKTSYLAPKGFCDEIRNIVTVQRQIGTMDRARPSGVSAVLPAGVFMFNATCVMRQYGKNEPVTFAVSIANDSEFGVLRCISKSTDGVNQYIAEDIKRCGFKQES